MVLAIQAKYNAVTELSWYFNSMINGSGFQYGLNDDGIHLLNSGVGDDGVPYERTFTVATTDFGARNQKTCRKIELGIDTAEDFTVSVKADDQPYVDYLVTPIKSGLQRVYVPIGSKLQGRYWTVKISSNHPFTIDRLDGVFIMRPLGVRGY